MTPNVALAKWTLEDYHQMIAAGILTDRKVELLNGEIIEMPPEGEPHAYYASTVGDYLRACSACWVNQPVRRKILTAPQESNSAQPAEFSRLNRY